MEDIFDDIETMSSHESPLVFHPDSQMMLGIYLECATKLILLMEQFLQLIIVGLFIFYLRKNCFYFHANFVNIFGLILIGVNKIPVLQSIK